jgi:hypothetical protein
MTLRRLIRGTMYLVVQLALGNARRYSIELISIELKLFVVHEIDNHIVLQFLSRKERR